MPKDKSVPPELTVDDVRKLMAVVGAADIFIQSYDNPGDEAVPLLTAVDQLRGALAVLKS